MLALIFLRRLMFSINIKSEILKKLLISLNRHMIGRQVLR